MNPTELVTLREFITVAPLCAMFLISLIPLLVKPFLGGREPNPLSVLVWNFLAILAGAGCTGALFGHSFTKTLAFSNAIVLDGTSVWMSYLAADPVFDSFHSDQWFQDLSRRVGLST